LSFETKSVKSKQFSDTSNFFQDPEDLENFQKPHTEDTAKEKDFNKFRTTLKYSEVNQWKNILIQFFKFNNKGLIPSRKTCRVSKLFKIKHLESFTKKLTNYFSKRKRLKEI
jgi:hypothetical protein